MHFGALLKSQHVFGVIFGKAVWLKKRPTSCGEVCGIPNFLIICLEIYLIHIHLTLFRTLCLYSRIIYLNLVMHTDK